jgi:hypothetical protein
MPDPHKLTGWPFWGVVPGRKVSWVLSSPLSPRGLKKKKEKKKADCNIVFETGLCTIVSSSFVATLVLRLGPSAHVSRSWWLSAIWYLISDQNSPHCVTDLSDHSSDRVVIFRNGPQPT